MKTKLLLLLALTFFGFGMNAQGVNTLAIVGEAVGGWPGDAGNPGPIDVHQMTSSDGVTWSISNLVVTNAMVMGGAKFRANNAWTTNWGNAAFPVGTGNPGGSNINTTAGTYNVTFNTSTLAYSFTPALSTSNFQKSNFKVYPNPTTNNWNFSSNDAISAIQIFDVLGKSVISRNFSTTEVSINASDLNSSIYFARIVSGTTTQTIKLVKN